MRSLRSLTQNDINFFVTLSDRKGVKVERIIIVNDTVRRLHRCALSKMPTLHFAATKAADNLVPLRHSRKDGRKYRKSDYDKALF